MRNNEDRRWIVDVIKLLDNFLLKCYLIILNLRHGWNVNGSTATLTMSAHVHAKVVISKWAHHLTDVRKPCVVVRETVHIEHDTFALLLLDSFLHLLSRYTIFELLAFRLSLLLDIMVCWVHVALKCDALLALLVVNNHLDGIFHWEFELSKVDHFGIARFESSFRNEPLLFRPCKLDLRSLLYWLISSHRNAIYV